MFILKKGNPLKILRHVYPPLSTTKKIWSDINRLAGFSKIPIKRIQTANALIKNSSSISEQFKEIWAKYGADENFSNTYIDLKESHLSSSYNPTTISPFSFP